MKIFEFLTRCRQYFNKLSLDAEITFIIGNQSTDLDSIISSISLSYYKYLKLNQSIKYLPILNTTRRIIETKDECKYLFDYHKIDINDLIFLNELTNENKIKYTNSKIFLVDHNKLDDNELCLNFQDRISGIIDHHKDENLFIEDCKNEARIIDNTIASNCFLITEVIRKDETFDFNEQSLATMLLFAILADTNNMSPERPRVTERDNVLFDYLISKANFSLNESNDLYSKINYLKVNSSNNKPIDLILQNDYKQWTFNGLNGKSVKYGVSSVLLVPKLWVEKETEVRFLNEITSYMSINSLDLFFILALFNDNENKLCRDLFIFGSKDICQSFLRYPENSDDIRLNFEMTNGNTFGFWINTKDAKKTRKFWQPRIEDFLTWSEKNQ